MYRKTLDGGTETTDDGKTDHVVWPCPAARGQPHDCLKEQRQQARGAGRIFLRRIRDQHDEEAKREQTTR